MAVSLDSPEQDEVEAGTVTDKSEEGEKPD